MTKEATTDSTQAVDGARNVHDIEDAGAATQMRRDRPFNNALYATSAAIVSKLFSYVLFLYSTRVLAQQGFGLYSSILVFVGLFGLLTDLGLSTLVVRDLAQDRAQATRYVSNVMAIRVFGAAVAVITIVVLSLTPVLPSALNGVRLLVFLYAVSLIPIAVGNTLTAIFQYTERLIYSAAFNIGESASIALLSIIALRLGAGIAGMVTVFTAVRIVSAIIGIVMIYRRGFLPLRFEVDLSWWPQLVRQALPFMVLTLLNVLYAQADTLLLTYMKGSIAVGLYRAAYRYLDILAGIIGANLGAATLPAFSRVSAESHMALARLTALTVRVMVIVSLPITLWGTFYAPQVLALNGSGFGTASGLALRILIWAFPLFLIETPLYQALYAIHRQRDVTTFFVVTLTFNLAANLLVIPHYSFLGSAVITVASEVLNLALTLIAVRRHVTSMNYGAVGFKPFIASVVLVVIFAALTIGGASMWIGVPISGVLYMVALRVLHVLGPQEYEIIARLPLGRRIARLVGAAPVQEG